MSEDLSLNLTEVLTALQDFMTKDGSISAEQRSFYQAFRQHLNGHDGDFLLDDIEHLLGAAKEEVPDISAEEFTAMGEAILTRYRSVNEDAINERIRKLAEEEARKRALAEEERKKREEEERLRLEEEERLRAEEEERLRLEEEERLRREEEERLRQEEEERLRREEEERLRAEEEQRRRLEEEERLRQEEEERLRLEEEERLRREEEERLRLEEEERRRLEEERLAEEARLQAELEAQAAEKQAYWDQQGSLPGDEAKIVPDLPGEGPALTPTEGTNASPLPKIVAAVIGLSVLGGLAMFML